MKYFVVIVGVLALLALSQAQNEENETTTVASSEDGDSSTTPPPPPPPPPPKRPGHPGKRPHGPGSRPRPPHPHHHFGPQHSAEDIDNNERSGSIHEQFHSHQDQERVPLRRHHRHQHNEIEPPQSNEDSSQKQQQDQFRPPQSNESKGNVEESGPIDEKFGSHQDQERVPFRRHHRHQKNENGNENPQPPRSNDDSSQQLREDLAAVGEHSQPPQIPVV